MKMLTETLLRIPFFVIGRCSLLPTSYWLQRKCARIKLTQAAASCMILKNHRQLPVSIYWIIRRFSVFGTGYWKDCRKLVSYFKGAS